MGDAVKADKTLDIRGLSLQRPQQVTGDVLRSLQQGSVLQVIADDASTRQTIPVLCERLGCRLLSVEEDRNVLCFIIRT